MDEEDHYPLFEAIEDRDVAAVESFLQTPGIDVDIAIEACGFLLPLLNWAIHLDQTDIVEVLLAHGAAVNGPVGAWITPTPLQVACDSKIDQTAVIKVLLDNGADVDAMTAYRRMTPLTIACVGNSNLGIIQMLLIAGADVNGGGGVIAPLHSAAYFGNQGATQLLIEAGADVNRVSTEVFSSLPVGSTPLHFAASYRSRLGCVTHLLAAGADPRIVNEAGQTPLHFAAAAFKSSVDVVNAMLTAGCDPLHRDNDGRTPLQYACYLRSMRYYHPDVITALVAAGDRSWQCVPTPCPGLEAAMLSVWQAAPDELPQLVRRLKNPPRSLIKLYARMDDEEMKKVVQEVLRVLHHHFSSFPHLKEHLLKSIFGLTTV